MSCHGHSQKANCSYSSLMICCCALSTLCPIRICSGKFAFPHPKKHGIGINDEAKLLIRGLLNKNCGERVGSSLTLGDEEIRTNPWFQGLLTEYHDVFLAEKVTPPWQPDIDDDLDASYFGSHDSVEMELRSKKKGVGLDRKAQKLFEGF